MLEIPVWYRIQKKTFTDNVNRNKQNAWLGNFANNSTAGKTGNKENPVEEGAKKDSSKQEDSSQPQGKDGQQMNTML